MTYSYSHWSCYGGYNYNYYGYHSIYSCYSDNGSGDLCAPKTLLSESFNRICDPDDSHNIVSDGHWDVRYNKLYTDGHNDGSVVFTSVAASDPVEITLDIKSDGACKFEASGQYADSLKIEAKIDGDWVLLDEFIVDEHTNTLVGSKTGQTFDDHGSSLSYSGGALDGVDESVQLRITSDISASDERIYIDNVKITSNGECTTCEGTDFNDLHRGEVVSDQIDGVTISAQRAGDSDNSENDAMIFDSMRPTGRDWDLQYANQGKILIISEDNDSGDPDDNAHGGKFTFDFDAPSDVTSIKALDNEEGGTIKLFDADGALIKTVDLTKTPNNGQATVDINAEGVSQMIVELNGSGALDDLCFEPTPNTDPEAMDDSAAVCAEEDVLINVLDNDEDVDGDALTIHEINGSAVQPGDVITLDSGAAVTVNDDGTLSYDSAGGVFGGVAAEDLLIGEEAMDSFMYTVSDGNGGEAEATVDLKICGGKNTVQTIAENVVPDAGQMMVMEGDHSDYTVVISGTGNPAIDGTFEDAYCIDFDAPLPSLQDGGKIDVEIDVAGGEPVDYDVTSPNQASPDIEEDLDNIGWILNEDFGSQGYTEAEIQAAIWGITNLTVKDTLPGNDGIPDKLQESIAKTTDGSTVEKAMEIYNLATTEGEGYEATEAGDIVALILTPDGSSDDVQPFVVGIDFEDLEEDCECLV